LIELRLKPDRCSEGGVNPAPDGYREKINKERTNKEIQEING